MISSVPRVGRRLLAAAPEKRCLQTAEVARLRAELQRESREWGRLEAAREEGVVLVGHILMVRRRRRRRRSCS